jgi:hypothetical protein
MATVAHHVLRDLNHRRLSEPIQQRMQAAVATQRPAEVFDGDAGGGPGYLAERRLRAGRCAEVDRQPDHSFVADGGDFDHDLLPRQRDQGKYRRQWEVDVGDRLPRLVGGVPDLRLLNVQMGFQCNQLGVRQLRQDRIPPQIRLHHVRADTQSVQTYVSCSTQRLPWLVCR